MQNGGTKVQQFDLDDFNLNSGEALWDTQIQAGRDPRAIGSKVVSTSGNQPQIGPQIGPQIRPQIEPQMANNPIATSRPELGQIVNLEMPPAAEVENTTEMPASQDPAPAPIASAKGKDPLSASLDLSFNKADIKTTEKLSKSGVAATRNVINAFHRQNNPKDFYDTVRGEDGIMAANLKQSYNRTIGES